MRGGRDDGDDQKEEKARGRRRPCFGWHLDFGGGQQEIFRDIVGFLLDIVYVPHLHPHTTY